MSAITIIIAVTAAIHVLTGVFWAGSTFQLARTGGLGAEAIARPQMAAATVAVLAGIALGGLMQPAMDLSGQVLIVGIICAVAAAGVQGAIAMPAARRLAQAGEAAKAPLRSRVALGQRIAAALLAITVICMAIARYL